MLVRADLLELVHAAVAGLVLCDHLASPLEARGTVATDWDGIAGRARHIEREAPYPLRGTDRWANRAVNTNTLYRGRAAALARYRERLLRHHGLWWQLRAALCDGDEFALHCAFYRGRRDRDFGRREVALLEAVLPALLAERAARLGYDSEEHAGGWALWSAVVGVHLPSDLYLAVAEQALVRADATSVRDRVRWLDRFENMWFPRTANAIRRFVTPAQREAVLQAFFEDLPQQPEGPP